MSEVQMDATPRDEFGKGAARRIRRAGNVPAVVYGHGTDPVHVTLPGRELTRALKQQNVLIQLAIAGGSSQLTLPKSVQRDPVRQIIEHVDLVIIDADERVIVDVPIALVGQAEPGGIVDHADTLSISAKATSIPSSIEVSIAGLAIGTILHASEVTLPDGVELNADPGFQVVHIVAPQVEAAPVAEVAAEGAAEPAPAGD